MTKAAHTPLTHYRRQAGLRSAALVLGILASCERQNVPSLSTATGGPDSAIASASTPRSTGAANGDSDASLPSVFTVTSTPSSTPATGVAPLNSQQPEWTELSYCDLFRKLESFDVGSGRYQVPHLPNAPFTRIMKVKDPHVSLAQCESSQVPVVWESPSRGEPEVPVIEQSRCEFYSGSVNDKNVDVLTDGLIKELRACDGWTIDKISKQDAYVQEQLSTFGPCELRTVLSLRSASHSASETRMFMLYRLPPSGRPRPDIRITEGGSLEFHLLRLGTNHGTDAAAPTVVDSGRP